MKYLLALLTLLSYSSWGQDSLNYKISGELPEALVTGARTIDHGVTYLSKNHFLNLSGTFDDPSRLLQAYPSIAAANDQNNAIVYRGLPSELTTWSLNGVPIVNPNHLSNAGTRFDVANSTSGGVNLFSGQALSGMDMRMAPALSYGVGPQLNMRTRRDTASSRYVQMSLIGPEAGFVQNLGDGWQVMGNGRYSFTGLLADMGVTFDGEEIRFGEGVMEVRHQGEKSHFSIVGAYGRSSNVKDTLAEVTELKDALPIRFEGSTKILVGRYDRQLRDWNLTAKAGWSRQDAERHSQLDSSRYFFYESHSELIDRNYFGGITAQHGSGFGLSLAYTKERLSMPITFAIPPVPINYDRFYIGMSRFDRQSSWLAIGMYTRQMGEVELDLSGGVNYFNYLGYMEDKMVKPVWRIHATLDISDGWMASGLIARNNQTLAGRIVWQNNVLMSSLATGDHLSLGLVRHGKATWRMSGFMHQIGNLSGIRDYNMVVTEPLYLTFGELDLSTDGGLRSYGVEGSVETGLEDDWHVLLGGSVYNVEQRAASDLAWEQSFYDTDFTIKANVSKTWPVGSKRLRVAASGKMNGGFVERVIDAEESDAYTVALAEDGARRRLGSFQRVDLRVSYMGKRSRLSLDIQNLLGRRNEAYQYYDALLGEVLTQEQLSLVPVLSWRWQW